MLPRLTWHYATLAPSGPDLDEHYWRNKRYITGGILVANRLTRTVTTFIHPPLLENTPLPQLVCTVQSQLDDRQLLDKIGRE